MWRSSIDIPPKLNTALTKAGHRVNLSIPLGVRFTPSCTLFGTSHTRQCLFPEQKQSSANVRPAYAVRIDTPGPAYRTAPASQPVGMSAGTPTGRLRAPKCPTAPYAVFYPRIHWGL